MSSDFDYLAHWYAAHCDGDWEHDFGIRIQTLDSPGWSISIDLSGTAAAREGFEEAQPRNAGRPGLFVESTGGSFVASCEPLSLRDVMEEFRRFAERDDFPAPLQSP